MLSRRRFLIGSSLLTLAGCSRRSGEEQLLIGHVGPLSGANRAAGEAAQHGMILAVEEANGEGGRFAILHADSRGSAERARSEAVRLFTLNAKLTAIVGGRDQAAADSLAQALQPYSAVLLTSAPCSTPGLEGVFSLDVAPSFRGDSLARFVAAHLKAKQAILLTDETSPFSAAVASAFAARWRSSTGHSLLSLDARSDESIARLSDRLDKTDAVVVAASADVAGKVSTALRAKKSDLPLVFAGEPAEWQRFERDGQGAFTVTVYAPGKFDEGGKKFLTKYKEKLHEDADADACRGYEMIRVLTAALRETKGTGGLRLRDELEKKEYFPGLTGVLHFKDGRAVRPLFAVRAGDSGVLQSFEGS